MRLSQTPLCPSGGAWVGPDVGSTVAWQDTADNRAPLVASVLEQFGRMTALAKETTSNLLTSTAYWGAQPGQHHLTSCCALLFIIIVIIIIIIIIVITVIVTTPFGKSGFNFSAQPAIQ